MKEILSIRGIKTSKDVNKIRQAIATNEGILACKIEKNTGAVEVVFDSYANIDNIIASIENIGFTVV